MTDLSTHPTQAASAWLADFASALERLEVDAAVALFEPDGYWRHLVAFTWNICTQEGAQAILALGSDTPKDPGPWEGELRNMWKPTQVPKLWVHGGNLHQSRHYSQFLALQLKARMEGLPTPVYELAASHHRR